MTRMQVLQQMVKDWPESKMVVDGITVKTVLFRFKDKRDDTTDEEVGVDGGIMVDGPELEIYEDRDTGQILVDFK